MFRRIISAVLCVFICAAVFSACGMRGSSVPSEYVSGCTALLNEKYGYEFDVDKNQTSVSDGVMSAVVTPKYAFDIPCTVTYDVENEKLLGDTFSDVIAGKSFMSAFSSPMSHVHLDGSVLCYAKTDNQKSYSDYSSSADYITDTNAACSVYIILRQGQLDELGEEKLKQNLDYVFNLASGDIPVDFDAYVLLSDADDLDKVRNDLCISICKGEDLPDWFYTKHLDRK